MRKSYSMLFIFSMLCVFTLPLAAQVPSRPEIVGVGEIRDLDTVLNKLSRYYFEGRWDLLQHEIDNLGLEKTPGGHKIDPKKNYYLVVFLSHEEGGAPRLIRFAWRKPAPDPYAARIPGRKEIFEIVLGAGSDLELKTSYVSTERENQFLSEIPKFVKKVEPVLEDRLKTTGGRLEAPAVNFEVRRVVLPFARAKIKVADVAVLNEAGLAKAVKTAGAKMAGFLVYQRAEAKTLADRLLEAIRGVKTGGGKDAPAERFRAAVQTAYKAYVGDHRLKGEDLDQAAGVEKEFLDTIKEAGAEEVKASFEYENVPWERVSLGLVSAYMLDKGYADDRVRLTDYGYYAAAPPANFLAAAILNIHPFKYDPESSKMTFAERFRLFTGIVLNPDAGVCAGAGFALLRGLSINGGLALMGIPMANNPRALVVNGRDKTLPENPKDPFKTKWRTAGFIGVGYSF